MSKAPLIFSVRVQSQIADANLGTKGLNALMGVLDGIRVTSIEAALLGDGGGADCILNMDISIVGVRSAPLLTQLASMVPWARNAVRSSKAARALPPTMYGVPTIDLLAAVFLYTAENPYPLYSCITTPLNVSGTRTLQSLQQQLPFMKLFTLGLLALSTLGSYHFKGALYRGVDVSRSAAFQAKYDSHATAYQVGTTITFVAPTSFSTSDTAAGAFTKGIQFVVPDGDGVSLDDVSAFDEESEVVVNGPSSWEVVAATMTPTGTLVVVIKRLPAFVTFLTHEGDIIEAAPFAAVSATFALSAIIAAPAAASSACLASLSSSDVATLVSSRGPAYAAYALQFEKDGIDGTVLENSSIDELIEIMNGMGVNTVHRLALKAAMTQWKQHAHLAVAIVAQASKPFGDADVGQWASLQALGFTAAGIIAATNASELFCAVGFNALVLAGFNVSSILKRCNDHMYMTAHGHPCNSPDLDQHRFKKINDGDQPVDVPSGWDVAPSDDSNIRGLGRESVIWSNWSTAGLVFSDGSGQCTYGWECQCYTWPKVAGALFAGNQLVRQGSKVCTTKEYYDVILRKKTSDVVRDLRALGCSWEMFQKSKESFTAAVIRAGGCDVKSAIAAGYQPIELKAGGFTVAECLAAGYDWAVIKTFGFSAAQLKVEGCALATLIALEVPGLFDAGYTFNECITADPKKMSIQYNGYTYATLHSHAVDGQICVGDGNKFVNIEPGWEVAPGNDPNVHRVCGAHAWQSAYLTLADGGYCCTAPNGSNGSVAGKYTTGTWLKKEGEKIAGNYEVLLRKKA